MITRATSAAKQKCVYIYAVLRVVAQSCPTLCDPTDCSCQAPLFMGILKNTGVGCHALLQGIFQIQGLNPGLPTLYMYMYIYIFVHTHTHTYTYRNYSLQVQALCSLTTCAGYEVSLQLEECYPGLTCATGGEWRCRDKRPWKQQQPTTPRDRGEQERPKGKRNQERMEREKEDG